MITPDSPYFAQVRLLVAVLPIVARERCFALKGGTAINLFVRDMPRLSVDIDLAFVPVGDRATALEEINAALGRISETLAGRPYGYRVSVGKRQDGSAYARILNPTRKPLDDLFERQFSGMTAETVTIDELDRARTDLIAALHQRLGEPEKAFLMSFKRGVPGWDLLGLAHAADLPAVRWKLQNLAQMSPEKHRAALDNLERVLGSI